MMRRRRAFTLGLALSLVAGCGGTYLFLGGGATAGELSASSPATTEERLMAALSPGIFDFTLNDIDGKPLPLNQFKGKVLLVVNTASFCGNTPQYADLQAMYDRYQAKGFEILAFPANNFGQQEPGTNEEIKTFCFTKYSLTFPLFSKISVKGAESTRCTNT